MATVKGGDKLRKKIRDIVGTRITLKVGFLENATYPDGMNVPTVGYLNEYGGHNPPRPFMKRTVDEQGDKWTEGVRKNLKKMGVTRQNLKKTFDILGQVAVGDIKNTISTWEPDNPRPNAPATIQAKARRARDGKGLVGIDPNKVLVDSGRMIAALDYEVDY